VFTLRPYRPADAPDLLALFRDTIRRVNSRDYSPPQIRAWASDDIDPVRWAEWFDGSSTTGWSGRSRGRLDHRADRLAGELEQGVRQASDPAQPVFGPGLCIRVEDDNAGRAVRRPG
jgi:hypothetical protein